MILYHNADIWDIDSIVKNGLLPMSVTGNNKWTDNKRAGNSCDVVYLSDPLHEANSFVQYGAALIEVDVDNPHWSEIDELDTNKDKYFEYTCPLVPPEKILKIYIPKIFKEKIATHIRNRVLSLCPEAIEKIEWVTITADIFDKAKWESNASYPYIPATADQLESIVGIRIDGYCYFTGINEKGERIDFENVIYFKNSGEPANKDDFPTVNDVDDTETECVQDVQPWEPLGTVAEYLKKHPDVRTEHRISTKGKEMITVFYSNRVVKEYPLKDIDHIQARTW